MRISMKMLLRAPVGVLLALLIAFNGCAEYAKQDQFNTAKQADFHATKRITSSDAAQQLVDLAEGAIDKGEKKCGVNCLYLFLRAHGKQHEMASVDALVRTGEHGASLASLAEASCHLGLKATSVQCNPKHWSQLPLPAIVHMERLGDDTAFLHYVLLTSVNERGVQFFDPLDYKMRFFNYAQLTTIFSGYCLISEQDGSFHSLSVFHFLGVALTAAGAFGLLWNVSRRLQRSQRRLVGLFCVVLSLAGCQESSDGPNTTIDTSEPAKSRPKYPMASESSEPSSHAQSIAFKSTEINLGEIEAGTLAEAEFSYVNNSRAPVTLQLASVECACISTRFHPEGPTPPKAEGKVVIRLDTSKTYQAGVVRTCAVVTADSGEFSKKLCVKGVRLGVLAPPVYVVRPHQLGDSDLPNLELEVLSRDHLDFELTKVTCASFAEYSQMLTVERDRIHTESVSVSSPLLADMDGAKISEQEKREGEAFRRRLLSIPMHLNDRRQFSGVFIVDYRLGMEDMQVIIKALLIPDE